MSSANERGSYPDAGLSDCPCPRRLNRKHVILPLLGHFPRGERGFGCGGKGAGGIVGGIPAYWVDRRSTAQLATDTSATKPARAREAPGVGIARVYGLEMPSIVIESEGSRHSRDSDTCAILNIAPSLGFTRLHAMAMQKTQPATHVMCPGVPLDAGRAGLRSPNLDELDALMEKVQAKAPAVGDSATATLVLPLALIDVKLAALEMAVAVGEGPARLD
jgi:hypothetical protein